MPHLSASLAPPVTSACGSQLCEPGEDVRGIGGREGGGRERGEGGRGEGGGREGEGRG